MAVFMAFLLLSAMISNAIVSGEDALQDLCVADLASGMKVNGYPCKAEATAMDFFSDGLAKEAIINNTMGSVVTGANVQKVPGLNTMGMSMSRIDYAPGGLNPPHTHPRASEIVFVLHGELEVGFITTANVVISKTIKQGEMFAFPKGLVHYQKNNKNAPASVIAAFNSQLPGTQSLVAALFASSPPMPNNVLTKALQVSPKQIEKMKSRLAPKK